MSETFHFSIAECARCGDDHLDDSLEAVTFDRRPDWDGECPTHWATCPNTGDPIMVYTEVSDE
jgi:hypothetical protein